MKFFYTLIFLFSFTSIFAQTSFPEKCLGIWTGTMHIYSRGSLVDSVPIKLNVTRTNAPDTFIWKTEYLSTKNPMVKDYKLVISDAGYYPNNGEAQEKRSRIEILRDRVRKRFKDH